MYENLHEKKLSRTEIYDGKVLRVVRDDVLLPNGEEAIREFCLHVGAVCVIPLTDDGQGLMERQFRRRASLIIPERIRCLPQSESFARRRELLREK